VHTGSPPAAGSGVVESMLAASAISTLESGDGTRFPGGALEVINITNRNAQVAVWGSRDNLDRNLKQQLLNYQRRTGISVFIS